MDHQKRKPDDFNMTTLFGIIAALVIVVISASAAGQHFFESDIPENAGTPHYGSEGTRTPSLLPPVAYKGLTEDLTQEIDDATLRLDRQLEENRSSDDDIGASEESGDETVPADRGVFSELVTDLVPAAQTRTLVAAVKSTRDTVTGAMELKEDVEKVTEKISGKRAVVLTMYGIWKTAFSNAWLFLKGISSAIWGVFEQGSHYTSSDSA